MDNVDRSITVAMIATYGAFGIGIRPSATTTSVYEGAASPVPQSYYGKLAIDMVRAPENSARNAAGFPRNFRWFWKEVLRERPEWFNEANEIAITKGEAPKVNETWVKYHPEHQSFMNDTLVHHHMAQGRYAVPLPKRVHQAWTNTLHPND